MKERADGLLNVVMRWVVLGITAKVDVVFGLVDPNGVNVKTAEKVSEATIALHRVTLTWLGT